MSSRIFQGQRPRPNQRPLLFWELFASFLVAHGAMALAAAENTAADRHGDTLPASAVARLGTTYLRHQAGVTFVCFGVDDKSLFTAGRDSTVRLWDLVSGKELRRFAIPKAASKLPRKGSDAELDVMELMAGGQSASSFSIAVAPNGKTVAIGAGNIIQVYDSTTGKELRRIEGAPTRLASLLFSPNGQMLAARASNGAIYLWAAVSGKLLHQIKPSPRKAGNAIVLNFGGGDPDPAGIAFSPDSKVLAAASLEPDKEADQGAIKFWEVDAGKLLRQIKAAKGTRASAIAYSRHGSRMAYASGGVIYLCQEDDGKHVHSFKAADGGIRTIVFSPDGSQLVSRGSDQRIRLWESATGNEIRELAESAPARRGNSFGFLMLATAQAGPESRAVAFSRDGARVVAAAGNTVRLWEATTGKEVHLRDGHHVAPSAIVHSAGGDVVVSWGGDRVIRRWDSAGGRSLGAFPAPPRTTLAAFSPNGRMIALGNADKTIRLHDTANGKELQRFNEKNSATALAFAPDGKSLASRGGDDVIRIYDLQRGSEVRRIQMRTLNNRGQPGVVVIGGSGQGSIVPGPGLAFSPDGRLLAATASGASTNLLLFDVVTGKEIRSIVAPQGIGSFVFSPDGRSLAIENADWTITLWEVASGKQQAHMGKPVASRQPANGGMNGVAFIIDGLPAGGANSPTGPVHLSYSADGRALAGRGPGDSVRVWDVTTGEEVGQFKGHDGSIETVAFAPDSRKLASGAADTTILLWDAAAATKNLSKPQTVQLAPDDLKTRWNDLAGSDAVRARRSMFALAADTAQVVPFLIEQLKPVIQLDPQKLDRWIADLSNEKFLVRKEANEHLLDADGQAVLALQKALKTELTLETRRRIEGLLNQLTGGTLTVQQLRLFRALEVLERMNTPEARRLLRNLAQGAPTAFATQESQAVLDRLTTKGRENPR